MPWLLRSFIFVAFVIGLRAWLPFRAVRRALLDGEPRRARALLRVLARRAIGPDKAWLALQEARALFWEGQFDRAMARCDETPFHSLATKIACLMFTERPEEARQLFDANAPTLRDASRDPRDPTAALLEAMLAFHEEDPSSQPKLEALVREAPGPFTRVAHFYLAALDHKQGRPERARSELLAARSKPGVFVTRWAEDTYEQLFGDLPARPPPAPTRREWPALLRDLGRGPSIFALRRFALSKSDWTFERAALLGTFNLVLLAALVAAEHTPGAFFMMQGVAMRAAPVLLVPFVAFLATRALGAPHAAQRFACAIYAVLPLFLLADWAVRQLAFREAGWLTPTLLTGAEWLLGGWLLVVAGFVARRLAPRGGWLRNLGTVALFAMLWLPVARSGHRERIWWEEPDEVDAREEARAEEREEAFVAAQDAQVTAVNATFAPGRPGVTDLYFVGFAGWGEQDVFLHEATFAQKEFDRRFDTRGRSAVLANDLSVRDERPMASKLNLSRVLSHLGTQMNVDDDVLVLLVTSHGDFEGIGLREPRRPSAIDERTLTPGDLRDMLTSAGIQWRVLLVSGCRTGVFLPFFQDPRTMIVTAASSSRNSFGCGSGRDMTEFGRAVFGDTLARERLAPQAFTDAFALIAQREKDLGEVPSEPSMFVGKEIEAKLRTWSGGAASTPDGGP